MNSVSRPIGIAAALAVCSVALLAQTPALNVRLGLWEATVTTTIAGDLPDLDASKLTPQQRAQMEAAMKQLLGTRTNTHKSCMKSQADIENGRFFGDDDANCKTTVVKNTSSVIEAHRVCTGGNPRTEDVHIDATSPTAVTGTFKATNTTRGKTMNADGTLAARWLGADCGSVK